MHDFDEKLTSFAQGTITLFVVCSIATFGDPLIFMLLLLLLLLLLPPLLLEVEDSVTAPSCWVCRRVLTTSRGVVKAAAIAPAPLPANILAYKLNPPSGLIIFFRLSLDANMTQPYGIFIDSVVGNDL